MHVTGDRTAVHGLASVGFDDEGVEAQQWDIVRGGILVGYQLDRRMARLMSEALGTSRSNGCAYADSPGHVAVQRMANVAAAAEGGPTTEDLIGPVDRGIYVVGDKSWSIDIQRYNFQFTGQRFYRIENGRLAGQVKDVAYQATTTDFWGSMAAVGGPETYVLGGAFNCGKAQQVKVAPVSHGCPSALFGRCGFSTRQTKAGTDVMTTPMTPQDIVERCLELSKADDCVAVSVDESDSANMRWANNTLTTNGAMRSRVVTVVSTIGEASGTAAGNGCAERGPPGP